MPSHSKSKIEDVEKVFYLPLYLLILRGIAPCFTGFKVGKIENPTHWSNAFYFQTERDKAFLCYVLWISSGIAENIPMSLSALLSWFSFFFSILAEWLINKHVHSSSWEWQFIPTILMDCTRYPEFLSLTKHPCMDCKINHNMAGCPRIWNCFLLVILTAKWNFYASNNNF